VVAVAEEKATWDCI